MLQLLNTYPDADIKKSAVTVAKRHIWFLSETNVGLAFLDERIIEEVKEIMIQNLETKPGENKELKRLKGKSLDIEGKDISQFITKKRHSLNCLGSDLTEYCSGPSKQPGSGLGLGLITHSHSRGQVYDQGCINIDRSYKNVFLN